MMNSFAIRPQTQHQSPSPLVEWRFFDTSSEDALFDKVPVNRNEYTSHGYLDAKSFNATISSIDLKEGLAYNSHNETKELNSYILPDKDFSQLFLEITTKSCLPNSIDSETLVRENNSAKLSDALQEDDRSEENNQANEIKDSHETETLEDRECWQAFRQDIKLRRRRRDFPPLLASLSGKSCASQLSHRPTCVQLQRIRSNGRFILREVKTLPVVSFRPIRSQGRLVLQLIHRRAADVPLPLSTKTSTEKPAAAIKGQVISMTGPQIRNAENINFGLSRQFEQTSEDIFANQQTNLTPILRFIDGYKTNDSLPIDNLRTKEATESIKHENVHHFQLNITNNIKKPGKACSSNTFDDGKCSSNNRCFIRDKHRGNSCSFPEQSFQTSDYNIKLGCLAPKAEPKPDEKAVKSNNSTHSLFKFSVFKMRNVMRGIDPATSLRCKRSQRREEDYVPFWEGRCVASS